MQQNHATLLQPNCYFAKTTKARTKIILIASMQLYRPAKLKLWTLEIVPCYGNAQVYLLKAM